MAGMARRFHTLIALAFACLASCVGGDTRPSDTTKKTAPSEEHSETQPETGPAPPAEKAPSPPVEPPPPIPAEHGTSGLLQAIKPTLWRPAMVVENAWNALKKIPEQELVHEELRRSKLERIACRGLINFRALDASKIPPFGYRDTTRDRGWVRPTVARVMIEGLSKLREEFPDVVLSVGDLSQAGCGQLSHGSLIRYTADNDIKGLVQGPPSAAKHGPATQLLNASVFSWGRPTAQELVLAKDLGVEATRLETPEEHVLVEHHILSQGETPSGELYLKVATQRYRPLLITDGESPKSMLSDLRFMMKEGTLVASSKVQDWRSESGKNLWSYHWVHPARKRQMRILSQTKIKKRLRVNKLVEVHASRWQNKKPDSFPGLVRWFPARDSVEGSLKWSGWRQLYEAGHQTHLAGRDADLSYVTRNNAGHFAIDIHGIDLDKSWRWFEILDETSRQLGARVDRILVAPSVWRLFKAKFKKSKKRSRIWRLLRRVGGHDAHHHVRIEIPNKRIAKESLAFMRGLLAEESNIFKLPQAPGQPPKNQTPPHSPR